MSLFLNREPRLPPGVKKESGNSEMAVRLLIADDHEIVREGIKTLLRRSRPDWEICGEAGNGVEAVEACKALKPDIVILDITMPQMSGLEAAAKIAKSGLACRVLLFTMHESQMLGVEARQVGAQGFVYKSRAARDLVRAVDVVLHGGTFFGSEPPPEASNTPPGAPPVDSGTDSTL
jgi:DNA-binding NarL/FixJ family response regulator